MGDQDRRQAGDALEAVREGTRIEQNRGLVRRNRRESLRVGTNGRNASIACLYCGAQGYPGGTSDVRLLLALAVATCGLVIAPSTPASRRARRVPADLRRHPRFGVDRARPRRRCTRCITGRAWPDLPSRRPRRGSPSRRLCARRRSLGDARDYAVASQATVAEPAGPMAAAGAGHALARGHRSVRADGDGRPSSWPGPGCETARSPRRWHPRRSPPATRSALAAVISVAGQRVMHQYLLAHPASSTIVELAMWSTLPPLVRWPAVPDAQVLDAHGRPAVRCVPRIVPVRRSGRTRR